LSVKEGEFTMTIPEVEIKLVIREREIVGVESIKGALVESLTDDERKKFKKSPYGLRLVDSIYETQITESPTKCYMTIGGFKVIVPC
jgi:hypothetical protein